MVQFEIMILLFFLDVMAPTAGNTTATDNSVFRLLGLFSLVDMVVSTLGDDKRKTVVHMIVCIPKKAGSTKQNLLFLSVLLTLPSDSWPRYSR